MIKKVIVLLLSAVTVLVFASCKGSGGSSSSAGNAAAADEEAEQIISAEYFSDGDFKDVASETEKAVITLDGSSGTISDTSRGSSGSNVTITSKGIYRITGSSENVSVVVNEKNRSGNIYLILDSVTMENSNYSCISVEAADKVIIQLEGENRLTYSTASSDYDGAIYSEDDITVNGEGSLSIISSLHGIVCKNDVKLTGGTVSIESGSIGIKANDSVRVGGAYVTVKAGHDGVQINNSDGDSFFHMEKGSVNITAGYDGIDVGTTSDKMNGFVSLTGGTLTVTAGGGSGNSKSSGTSQKGIKCGGKIILSGADLTVSSADDALNSAAEINIMNGSASLSSSDDGIHADNILSISGGEVTVSKSYEGLEAYEVIISGGNVSVVSSDDGINAAGGSDTQSSETSPDRWSAGSTGGKVTVTGGTLYVNSSGDGIDSNGSIYITGGLIIVEGPENDGNGALDAGDGNGCVAEITGGTVLATGSAGMAVNFNSGTQCSALLGISGQAGTVISADDGSGFTYTATKSFECLVYSSPSMTKGSAYTVTAGTSSASADFSSGLYYSNVRSNGPGGGPGGKR